MVAGDHYALCRAIYPQNNTDLDTKFRLFGDNRPLDYFYRAARIKIEDNAALRERDDFLELLYFLNNDLRDRVCIRDSVVTVDPRFGVKKAGLGTFASRHMLKGTILYCVLETTVNVKVVSVKEGTLHEFDMGDTTALAPLPNKDTLFMMNHAEHGTRACNAEIVIDHREFATLHDTFVFVAQIKLTRTVNAGTELAFDYFRGRQHKNPLLEVGRVASC